MDGWTADLGGTLTWRDRGCSLENVNIKPLKETNLGMVWDLLVPKTYHFKIQWSGVLSCFIPLFQSSPLTESLEQANQAWSLSPFLQHEVYSLLDGMLDHCRIPRPQHYYLSVHIKGQDTLFRLFCVSCVYPSKWQRPCVIITWRWMKE